MSSIHEALKKAERERLVPPSSRLTAKAKSKSRRRLLWVVVAVVLVDLAIAAWIFLPTKVAQSERANLDAPTINRQKSVTAASPRAVGSRTLQAPHAKPVQRPPVKPPQVSPVAQFQPQPIAQKPQQPAQAVTAPSRSVTVPTGPSSSLQAWADQQTIEALVVKQSNPAKSFAIVSGKKVRRGGRFENGAVVTEIAASYVKLRDSSGTATISAEK